jgi:hypothetical protein
LSVVTAASERLMMLLTATGDQGVFTAGRGNDLTYHSPLMVWQRRSAAV